MKASFALLFAAASLLGCAVPFSSEVAEQQNTCTSDADCGDGVCLATSGGKICAATTVGLTGLKLVVTPAAGSSTVTTTPTVLDPAEQHVPLASDDDKSGFSQRFDATLPGLAEVTFSTVYPCKHSDKPVELPSQMVITSIAPTPGLPVSTFLTTVDPTDPNRQIASIPSAGLYSVYVVPGMSASTSCGAPPPPSIFTLCLQDACPKHAVRPSKVTTLSLTGDLPLSGTITTKISLSNWTLDLVDVDGARLLSDEFVFPPDGGVLTTQVQFAGLRFNWPIPKKPPTIRLTPPANSSAPTMYWDLGSALGASQTLDDVKLTLGDYVNTPQTTQVIVLDDEGKTPQAGARVTFQSDQIENLVCAGAVVKTLTADDDGQATVDLPPGFYTVRATPRDSSSPLSIGQTSLQVTKLDNPTKVSGGHSVVLPKKADIVGSIKTEAGEALSDVPVDAVPSQAVETYDLVGLTSDGDWSGRPATTTTDDDGRFSLKIDVGAPVDVSIRPADGTGYPWLVQPQFLLQKGGLVDKTLKGAELPWPALLRGRLTDPGGAPVGSAKVSAYLPLTLPDGATVVVQIGETATDADGNYELVLPASITSGK